jgi:hypothetical protein
MKDEERETYPGPARESSRVIVHVVGALEMAHGKHTGLGVERESSPIPNGLTAVACEVPTRLETWKGGQKRDDIRGAKTRLFFYEIGHCG